MGFDIFGLCPKSEKGNYFRNNVLWWIPLADFVLENCNVPEEEAQYWGSNDFQEVSADTALHISERLEELIESGEVKKYEKDYMEKLKNLPLIECELCKGTGKRNDQYVQGECNGCNGKGEREQFASWYLFSEENVKEFAEFCKESGGFEIG